MKIQAPSNSFKNKNKTEMEGQKTSALAPQGEFESDLEQSYEARLARERPVVEEIATLKKQMDDYFKDQRMQGLLKQGKNI